MRQKLIKWLGGYTKKETAQFCMKAIKFAKMSELEGMQNFMRDINGEDAEVWCDRDGSTSVRE